MGDTVLINGVQQGTDSNQRLGSVITQQSLDVDIFLPGSRGYGEHGQWAIVLDREPNGTVASFSDIFDMHLGAPRFGIGAGMAFLRVDTANRFQILLQDYWTGDLPFRYRSTLDLHSITSEFNSSSSCGIPITGALLLSRGSTMTSTLFYYNFRMHFADQQ